MQHTTHKRFKGAGIDGHFNLPYGTLCDEIDGFLYAPDGRCICAATSEAGWKHFHPDTDEGHARYAMLEKLYKHYLSGGDTSEIPRPIEPGANTYWKNCLRTMPTTELSQLYHAKFL